MSKISKGDITAELMLLKSLEGAAFGAKLKEIAGRKEFHALPDNPFIYTVGGDQDDDYPSLLMAARKAVEHGYRVFILPNPHGVKTPDYILERRGVYKLFDLKNISGKNIVLTRLNESANQANRALLNMPARYNTRMLAADIKNYFELLLSAKHRSTMPNLFITSVWAYVFHMTSPLILVLYHSEVLQKPVQA